MSTTVFTNTDTSPRHYREARQSHWNELALRLDRGRGFGKYYHRRLAEIYEFLVVPGQKVLELGCARGDLLAALKPKLGVGVDFSEEMIRRGQQRYPNLNFVQADVHDLNLDEQFDTVILSDLMNDLWDVQAVFEHIAQVATPSTRIILNFYSRLWELPLAFAERLGLAKSTLHQNWLTVEDVTTLLDLANFEVIQSWQEILWPLPFPPPRAPMSPLSLAISGRRREWTCPL